MIIHPKRRLGAGLGLSLLGALLASPAAHHPRENPVPLATRAVAPPPRTPSAAALRAAERHWARAQALESRERDEVEAWDPRAAQAIDPVTWRAQLMARDWSGDLRRARAAARRAAALATTPEESYQATLWLTAIEHDSGRHAAELQQARRLMALAPRRETSLRWLRYAALCNGQEALARQADAALAALPKAAHAGIPNQARPGF